MNPSTMDERGLNKGGIDDSERALSEKSISQETRMLPGMLIASGSGKKNRKNAEILLFAYKDRDDPFKFEHCIHKYYESFYNLEIKKKDVVKTVEWNTVVNTLKRYESINTLIIAAHGAAGQIEFDKNIALGEAESYFINRKTGDNEAPTVKTIHLEGCNIGDNPIALFDFGKLFNAGTVTAYNMFYHCNSRFIESQDVDYIEKFLKPIKMFLVPGQPDAKGIAEKKGRVTLYYEWFSYGSEKDLPEDYNYLTGVALMKYHQRNDAKEKHLYTRQDAENIVDEGREDAGMPVPKSILKKWIAHPKSR